MTKNIYVKLLPYRFVLVFVFIGIPALVIAQNAVIRGTLVNGGNGDHIGNAKVYLYSEAQGIPYGNLFVYSSPVPESNPASGGEFEFTNLSAGMYNLYIDHIGFHPEMREGVEVSSGSATVSLTVQITPRAARDYNNYTTAAEMGMTVTNYGILGEGWNNPDQPSALYQQYNPQQKKQVSHFSYSGLWIGGRVGGEARVSTAIVDGVFDYGEEGFEFQAGGTTDDSTEIRSSIVTNRYFSPKAVSHQDFIMNFDDLTTAGLGETHTPLGIQVHLEAYNWNYNFANSFVILNYTIKNVSDRLPNGPWIIEDLFAGIWMDCSVGNMNFTSIYEPGGGWTWYDNLDGFDNSPDENGYPLDLAYQFDEDGDNGWAESYIGLKLLGADVPREIHDSYYRQWVWTAANNTDYPDYYMPQDDGERYQHMQQNVQPGGPGETFNNGNASYNTFPAVSNSWIMLLSSGPFGTVDSTISGETVWTLPPGDSVNVVFGVVAGFWGNKSLNDSPSRRSNLKTNAGWALKAYNGEDVNGNGVLDDGEDTDFPNGEPNGEIDRYILPAPPPSPRLAVVPGNQQVTLYWDEAPLHALDPVSQEADFEGFRIYGARKTESAQGDRTYTLLREYDLVNGIGFDTGLEDIRIYDKNGMPSDTTIDGHKYQFRWTNFNLKNGWTEKNLYAVTSYDRGDERLKLASLESSINENRVYAVPGIRPYNTKKVGVYPNPYRAHAAWDGYRETERLLWFTYLPERCTIRIYTLSGDLVDEIEHDATSYRGQDVGGIDAGKNSEFSGGEHAWDLISKDDQAVASGMYLYTVEDQQSGDVKIGKFLVIK